MEAKEIIIEIKKKDASKFIFAACPYFLSEDREIACFSTEYANASCVYFDYSPGDFLMEFVNYNLDQIQEYLSNNFLNKDFSDITEDNFSDMLDWLINNDFSILFSETLISEIIRCIDERKDYIEQDIYLIDYYKRIKNALINYLTRNATSAIISELIISSNIKLHLFKSGDVYDFANSSVGFGFYDIHSLLLFDYYNLKNATKNKPFPEIRKCATCKEFFLVKNNRKARCCDKKCQQMYANKKYKEKIGKHDDIQKVFQKYYQKYYKRVCAGTLSKDEFINWTDNAKKQRDKFRKIYINATTTKKTSILIDFTKQIDCF